MTCLVSEMRCLNPNMQLLGSPRSPPAWMKINRQLLNSSSNNLKDGYLDNSGSGNSQQFANYFVKYIQAFNATGVDVNAITIQNEPLNSQDGYPTMFVSISSSIWMSADPTHIVVGMCSTMNRQTSFANTSGLP